LDFRKKFLEMGQEDFCPPVNKKTWKNKRNGAEAA